MDRIKINGEWYVKETSLSNPTKADMETSTTNSLECTYENKNWCFTASVILKDDAEVFSDIYTTPYIEVTDKRNGGVDDWSTFYIDNDAFMLGLLKNDTQSLNNITDEMDTDGIELLKLFIQHLVTKKWLIK